MYYYSLFAVFAIILALMVIDPNVGVYIDLQFKLLRIRVLTFWMRATMYPRIKYNNWQIQRRLKQFQREIHERET